MTACRLHAEIKRRQKAAPSRSGQKLAMPRKRRDRVCSWMLSILPKALQWKVCIFDAQCQNYVRFIAILLAPHIHNHMNRVIIVCWERSLKRDCSPTDRLINPSVKSMEIISNIPLWQRVKCVCEMFAVWKWSVEVTRYWENAVSWISKGGQAQFQWNLVAVCVQIHTC